MNVNRRLLNRERQEQLLDQTIKNSIIFIVYIFFCTIICLIYKLSTICFDTFIHGVISYEISY